MKSINIKKCLIPFFCLFGLLKVASQEVKKNPFGDKYDDKEFNGIKVIRVIDASGFSPIKLKDIREFKAAILQLSDAAFKQINIDTWYLCSFKHDEYFEIYNLYYKLITKQFYDENCKALITLMLLDGTIKQPK
jgi:hypothetical protein